MAKTLAWSVRRERLFPDRQLYCVHYTFGADDHYRIYGRWFDGEGYRFRAEYERSTGWWPVGNYRLLREAKAHVEAHRESQ